MWLEVLEEGFPCFLGRDWEGVSWGLVREPIISSKAVPEDLNVKFKSKFNHGFTNRGCLRCAILKAYKTRDMQFFKILKMFKHNMKVTRAAC